MAGEISKSDWKKFKALQAVALERLCKRILDELCGIAGDETKTHHERYLAAFRSIKEHDKEIADGFDMLSRSRMLRQLTVMKSLGLVETNEFETFSEEIQSRIKNFLSF